MTGRFTTTSGTPGLKSDHLQRLKTCKAGKKSVLQGIFFIIITNSQEATSPGKRLQKLVLEKCFVASWMEDDFLRTLNMPYL